MSRESTCRCLVCNLERTLCAEITSRSFEVCYEGFAHSRSLLSAFPSAPDLITFLHARKTNNGIPASDGILRNLLEATATDGGVALRNLLLLAFIPMLHSTSSQVASRYPSLPPEDIAQHAVLSLLQILGSAEFCRRSSHIAFAISRMLKRHAFEWAARETRLAVLLELEEAVPEFPSGNGSEPFERVALLRHFLHRCLERGLLTGDDLNLLDQFKLDAARDREPGGGPAAVYSNASRQRMKRLLGKLRRIARNPGAGAQLRLF